MHDDEEHNELDERAREKLNERRARSRTDWFARALGESWTTDGDGIYRYIPETSSLKVPAPPPAEERPAEHDPEDLGDALAPRRRRARSDADDERPTPERPDADDEAASERGRSRWRRR